jgi:hypothetical protein
MKAVSKELPGFIGRTTVAHVSLYFIFGIIFGVLIKGGHVMYAIEELEIYFRPLSHPLVMSSSFLNIFRGIIIALALYPFREKLFRDKYGWFYLWVLLGILGILSVYGAAPGSLEGVIYTKLPMWYHLRYLPDNLLHTLTFSVLLFLWERKKSKLVSIPLYIVFGFIVVIQVMMFASGKLG